MTKFFTNMQLFCAFGANYAFNPLLQLRCEAFVFEQQWLASQIYLASESLLGWSLRRDILQVGLICNVLGGAQLLAEVAVTTQCREVVSRDIARTSILRQRLDERLEGALVAQVEEDILETIPLLEGYVAQR